METRDQPLLSHDELRDALEEGAQRALGAWFRDWQVQKDAQDDLVQDLWLWYYGEVGDATRLKLSKLHPLEAVETFRSIALQTLSKQTLQANLFADNITYSGDSVKDALKGTSTNKYLYELLPLAMDALDNRNPNQAEAIRSRYEDGIVPAHAGGADMVLVRAIQSLTAEVNVMSLTQTGEGPGSAGVVFPDSRRSKGVHGDPTGDMAVRLLGPKPKRLTEEEWETMKREYAKETPLEELLRGKAC